MLGSFTLNKPRCDRHFISILVNERFQDAFAMRMGIEILIMETKTAQHRNKFDHSSLGNGNGLKITSRYITREWVGSSALIWVPDDETRDSILKMKNEKLNAYEWNKNIVFVSSLFYANKIINSAFKRVCLISGLLCFFVFGSALLIFKFHSENKGEGKSSSVLLLATSLLAACLLTFWVKEGLLPLNNPPLFDSQLISAVKKDADYLLNINNASIFIEKTSLPGINILKPQGIFISKTPQLPINYIRVNINPFAYLFIGNQIKDPKAINPIMDYEKISDNMWLGKYTSMIESTEELNYFCYIFLILAWGIFFIFICLWLKINVKRPIRKCASANEG